jgi:predicted transcriptional regulator of viral defense system
LVPKLYRVFYERRVFTLDDASPFFPDKQQARNAIHYMKTNGYLKQIKSGLYCIIPFEFQGKEDYSPDIILVASHLVEPYFFSHLTALHIYGFVDTPLPKIVVTSPKRFRRFTFQERIFQNVHTGHFFGFKTHPYKENLDVYISDLERTFLDCLNRLELAGGMVRFFRTMYSFGFLNYLLMMEYLQKIGNKTLMSKVGFTLDYLGGRWEVPGEIINDLKKSITGETVFYLDRNIAKGFGELNKDWNLIVPKSFRELVRPV